MPLTEHPGREGVSGAAEKDVRCQCACLISEIHVSSCNHYNSHLNCHHINVACCLIDLSCFDKSPGSGLIFSIWRQGSEFPPNRSVAYMKENGEFDYWIMYLWRFLENFFRIFGVNFWGILKKLVHSQETKTENFHQSFEDVSGTLGVFCTEFWVIELGPRILCTVCILANTFLSPFIFPESCYKFDEFCFQQVRDCLC